MPTFIALLLLGQLQTPTTVFGAATYDATAQVRPDRRPFTRYADLRCVKPEQRPALYRALVFAMNSTSFQSNFYVPPILGDILVRIDTEALGWDKFTRADEISKLEQLGVKFNFKDEKTKARFVDIWEDIGSFDPYYRVGTAYQRGWVNPNDALALQAMTESAHPVVRADWLVTRLMLERQDQGFYSQLLLLPANEADLYRRLGADIKFIDLQSQTRHGAAIVGPSAVARHNRELQVIPGAFGDIWRTFDFADAGKAETNVLLTFAGKVKHDGREIIFRMPNGLDGYYLCDGKGKQVNLVPQTIALDMRKAASHTIADRNVTNAAKCVSCHGPHSGLWEFTDSVKGAILSDGALLAVLSKDKRRVTTTTRDLKEYYLTDLDGRVVSRQAEYANAIQKLNGTDPGTNADEFMGAFDNYFWDVVTAEGAALEMGVTLERAKDLWLIAGNPLLALLRIGQPIRRQDWEVAFPDAANAEVHPWEQGAKAVPVKAGTNSGYR